MYNIIVDILYINIMESTDTKECYINKKRYSIDEFINNEMIINNYKKGELQIYDKFNNELIFADGKKISPYFRRLNIDENPMTDWHLEWQTHFKGYTEQQFKCDGMIKKFRRTDVDLNNEQNIEFQHSRIEKEKVNERMYDHKLNKKDIIWIINGNNTIEITELKHSNRVFLEFKSDPWKYQSFIDYDFIYIDINNKIYKICPKIVKSHMIDIQNPITKELFCNSLKKCTNPFDNDNIYQTNIYIKQQGAGNGKTYGVVQLLQDDKFLHYDIFVYLTKQHSAVHVIYSTIKEQQKNGNLQNIEIINDDFISKKHMIDFKNIKSNKECKIIIGTFDSFVWSMGDKNSKGVNKFLTMVNSIIDNELVCRQDGNIKYAGGIKLNKKLLLIGDEMQDLHENYMKAIIKITRDRYVDFYAVGDMLQSISIENNSFSFLVNNELPTDTINVNTYPKTNFCRRFLNDKLINFVNEMISFEKYKLPIIKKALDMKSDNEEFCLNVFAGKSVYSTDTEKNKINIEVEKIMELYKFEVENNNRIPEDFLIVTPFVNTNPLIEAFHISIREFWINKYKNKKEKYIEYSVFHKSESGSSIDLSESDHATRIVSIHSSKGDGRNVVFVIGITESALKKYSDESNNLVYNSLLHVALTRMKKKLYFRIEANNDDIHNRYDKYLSISGDINHIPPYLDVTKIIKLDNLIQNKQIYEKNFDICYEHIIKLTQYKIFEEIKKNDDDKKLIDLKHHCVRYAIFNILMLTQIINDKISNDFDFKKQQIFQIWKNCLEYKIIECTTAREYSNKLFDDNYSDKFPILTYNKEDGDYRNTSLELFEHIKSVRAKLTDTLKKNKSINLNPIESICLYYMMCICEEKQYARLPISDMYDIINIYKKIKIGEREEYLKSHYDKTEYIKKLYIDINKKYKNLKWLINHNIRMKGFTSNFEVKNEIQLIAYNDKYVVICYVKPQFNSVNFNEILLNSIFDTYLCYTTDDKDKDGVDSNNHERFKGKEIISCVLTFDKDLPFYIVWKDENNNDLILKNNNLIKDIIKKNLISIFKSKNKNVEMFYKYWKNEFDDKTPLDIILSISEEYQKIKNKNFPQYIDEFFASIKFKIQEEKKHGSKHQKKYWIICAKRKIL